MKMKHAMIAGLIVYFVVCGVFMHYFNRYLEKPGSGTWKQLRRHIVRIKTHARYRNEPIVFEPGWLRNYASDQGRLYGYNIRDCRGEHDIYWLVTFEENGAPPGHQVLNEIKIEGKYRDIVVMKLKLNER